MANVSELQGFDPLSESSYPGAVDRRVFEDATKRVVLNVLKSYTGYFDLFSEALQNAIDAIEAKQSIQKSNLSNKLYITIDIANSRVRIVDNGIGMNIDQFKYCFRPSVSFKNRREARGHKGVGATFLAYGFSFIRLQTKHNGFQACAVLRQGRQWAEDTSGTLGRPTFEAGSFDVPELSHEASGTCVEIVIGEGQRPQLTWLQANTASQWVDVLRIKSPLGGIYLSGNVRRPDVDVFVKVIDLQGVETSITSNRLEYLYPHEMPVLHKVKDIRSIEEAIRSIPGDPAQRARKLGDEFRRLDAVYEVWNKDEILSPNSEFSSAVAGDESLIALVEKHNVSIYGCFVSTAKSWTTFQSEHLRVRKSAILLRGGLQLATDYMVQGELGVIPLTSAIGYQANTHVVIHFVDGNPDMGRKVFQPEMKTLGDALARRAVAIFKRYISLMREDTGIAPPVAAKELWNWKNKQESWRELHPLEVVLSGRTLGIMSEPQSEQDVVALFHELVGAGLFSGIRFYATSEHDKYDAVFLTDYPDRSYVYSEENPLGVADAMISIGESEPKILEYKFDFDGFIADIEREEKFINDVSLVVCWTIGDAYKESLSMASLVVGDEGSQRRHWGATHVMFRDRVQTVEIICLRDIVDYLRSSADVVAQHKTRFR